MQEKKFKINSLREGTDRDQSFRIPISSEFMWHSTLKWYFRPPSGQISYNKVLSNRLSDALSIDGIFYRGQ